MKTCTFNTCGPTIKCVLVGGCLRQRFGDACLTKAEPEPTKPRSKALNGTKPASKRTKTSGR